MLIMGLDLLGQCSMSNLGLSFNWAQEVSSLSIRSSTEQTLQRRSRRHFVERVECGSKKCLRRPHHSIETSLMATGLAPSFFHAALNAAASHSSSPFEHRVAAATTPAPKLTTSSQLKSSHPLLLSSIHSDFLSRVVSAAVSASEAVGGRWRLTAVCMSWTGPLASVRLIVQGKNLDVRVDKDSIFVVFE